MRVGSTARTLAGIEALVPGFSAAIAAFDAAMFAAEPLEPFAQWFEGGERWASVVTADDGSAAVTVYEDTGQYCDEWRRSAEGWWLHVECDVVLDPKTGTVRDATDAERQAS